MGSDMLAFVLQGEYAMAEECVAYAQVNIGKHGPLCVSIRSGGCLTWLVA